MGELMVHQDHSHRRMPSATGHILGVIDGKAYGASNIYVIRSGSGITNSSNYDNNNHHRLESPARTNRHHHHRQQAVSRIHKSSSSSSSSWIDYRQLKRRKRIAKYKLYAYEGKVKSSFKNGIRWIKRTCRKIVHGF